MRRLFSNRRLLSLTIILIVSNLIITGVSLIVIYNKSIATLEANLIDIVERQKSLVTVLHEQGKSDKEIIMILKKMREKHFGIGKTGEFVIARQYSDSINFLLAMNEQGKIKMNNSERHGLPMQMALKGNAGYLIANDYNSVEVLAAYTYVPILQWGIVAKIPTSEVNKPYYEALFIALFITLLLILVGVYLFIKIYNPVIKGIIQGEEKYRRAIHDAPFPIMIHAENGEVLDISQGWTDISGYSQTDIPTIEAWTERAYGVRMQVVRDDIDALYRLVGRKDEGEYPVRCKDGSDRIWDFSSAALGRLEDGRRTVISMAKDVTQRKQAEEALTISEQSFRMLFENALSGIAIHKMVYDPNGKPIDYIYLSANQSFEKHTGMRVADVIGKHATEVHPDIWKSDLIQTYGTVASTGVPITFEIFFEPLNRHFSINAYQTVQDHFATIFQDITEHKQAELELKEKNEEIEAQSEEYIQINEELNQTMADLYLAKDKAEQNESRLLTFINSIPDVVCYKDGAGRWLLANNADLELFGLTGIDYLGKTDAELADYTDKLYKDSFLTCMVSDEVCWGNKITTRINEIIPTIDGGKKIFDVIKTPIFDKNGNRQILVIIARDITELQNTKDELLKAKEKAEESDRLKTAFLQNMSHEIRTPMNAIMGFSGLFVKNYNNKPKLEKFSAIINQRCDDLLEIINDILDIAKIESGQLSVNVESCNLNTLFAEITLFFKEQQKRLGKEQIKFNLQALCESTDRVIEIDKVKLKQIFINLISNAFKFTETGTIEGGCKLDANGNLTFYVSDTGIGIPPDKQKMIFERFIQVEQGTSRLYGGTGLGLSIVKGLVNLLGGEIYLESEFGKGSKFTFTIPYKTAPVIQQVPLEYDENEDFSFQNKTILVVEDDLFNTEYIKEILSDTGLNIIYTVYGSEAIKIAATHTPDLVLMDIRLPDMNGYEATRKIMHQNPNLKIIAQTAYAAPEDYKKATDAGCIGYISKPLKRTKLLSMINKHLSVQ
jgi:PAS domain S-box-containing protein